MVYNCFVKNFYEGFIMNIADNMTQLVGNTPMVKLNKLDTGFAEVYLKL